MMVKAVRHSKSEVILPKNSVCPLSNKLMHPMKVLMPNLHCCRRPLWPSKSILLQDVCPSGIDLPNCQRSLLKGSPNFLDNFRYYCRSFDPHLCQHSLLKFSPCMGNIYILSAHKIALLMWCSASRIICPPTETRLGMDLTSRDELDPL